MDIEQAMNVTTDNQRSPSSSSDDTRADASRQRLPYEAPRVLKKRSVAQVTLGTGMGQTTQPPVIGP
jgi:hypothetical protein